MSKVDNCVFCKIAAWETPSQRIFEDDHFIAFLDINPVNFGHTLIISREHYPNFVETPKDVICEMTAIAQKLAPGVMSAVDAAGCNIVFNNGEHAGQVIHHVHLHIIPRYPDDGHKAWTGRNRYAEGEMGATAKKIKQLISL